MKKLVSAVLALILVFAMSTTAFALGDTLGNGGKSDIAVNAKYAGDIDVPDSYSVDVTWGEMQFTYSVSGTKTWNPDTHTYDISTSDKWTASDNEITVKNNSNIGIKADFVYASKTGFDTVNGTLSSESITLPSAEGKDLDDAVLVGKTALTLGGTLSSDTTVFTNVGTVTVAISKA